MNLTRLYWYTVEFGLINTSEGTRIYGAGIVSSKGESIYSLDSPAPNRIGFGLERVMSARYRIDTFQQTYFVIDSFEQLFEATKPDFTPIYAKLKELPAHSAADVLDDDRVFTRGTREGFATNADA
jgi:phenylalanine-4-hydroxylase